MARWRAWFAGLHRATDLFLREIMENAGQEIRRLESFMAAVECDFCRDLSERSVLAEFDICGTNVNGKLLRVHSCPTHKEAVTSGENWFVNNLRTTRGMSAWKIVPRPG